MMASDNPDIAADSWQFALRIYAQPGVADACLTLQARAGVDVMLLLVAAFAAARRGIRLTDVDIAAMDDAARDWREQVVRPLRALRTALKSGPMPAPSAATEALRVQIKASELAAERLENDLLAEWLKLKSSEQRSLAHQEVHDILHTAVRHFAPDPASATNGEVSLALDELSAAVHTLM